MRKLLMIVASLVVAAAVYALPARSGVKKTVTQPDGSTLTLTLCGDEHFHYYTGPDGMPMRENAQGEWVKDTRDIAALWTASTKRRTAHRTVLAEKTRKLARMARTDRQKRDEPQKPVPENETRGTPAERTGVRHRHDGGGARPGP